MAERCCRAQIRSEIFRSLRINAKTVIRQWEKESNEIVNMQRKRAYYGKDRETVKHTISQEVFDFIKTKDIFHDLIHPHSDDKENLPLNGAQNMPSPPQDFSMESLPEDVDAMPRPSQDFSMESLLEDMDSVLEPILMQDCDMNSLLELNDTPIEDMDSLIEPITFDSLLELNDTPIEDMDSVLEPITFDSLLELNDTPIEDMDSLLEPIVVEDMDSLLEQPIAFSNSSNVDEFNEIVCRLDSLLEPVVLVERC